MLEDDEPPKGRPIIQNPKDFVGGAVIVVIAGMAFWTTRNLAGMHGFSFGAGTAPRIFASGLTLIGLALMALSLLHDGQPFPKYYWRGPLFVTAAVVLFAVAVRPWGLVITIYCTLILASLGSSEFRFFETIAWSAGLTLFCVLVFYVGLGLPLSLWPR